MFQFPSFPSGKLYDSFTGVRSSYLTGFPIRISAAHRLFAPTRSFSQLVTSFVGSQCHGILPVPLVA